MENKELENDLPFAGFGLGSEADEVIEEFEIEEVEEVKPEAVKVSKTPKEPIQNNDSRIKPKPILESDDFEALKNELLKGIDNEKIKEQLFRLSNRIGDYEIIYLFILAIKLGNEDYMKKHQGFSEDHQALQKATNELLSETLSETQSLTDFIKLAAEKTNEASIKAEQASEHLLKIKNEDHETVKNTYTGVKNIVQGLNGLIRHRRDQRVVWYTLFGTQIFLSLAILLNLYLIR